MITLPEPERVGPFARRVRDVQPFLAVEVFEKAQALERRGIDVIHLEFGEPDFDTPQVIQEAAQKAIKDGRSKYTASLGILPLREAIALHYRRTYGVEVSPDQVLITAGTSPAMVLLFTCLLDPGTRWCFPIPTTPAIPTSSAAPTESRCTST